MLHFHKISETAAQKAEQTLILVTGADFQSELTEFKDEFLASGAKKLKLGQEGVKNVTLPAPDGYGSEQIIVIRTENGEKLEEAEKAGGSVAAKLLRSGYSTANLFFIGAANFYSDAYKLAFLTGFRLRAYGFDKYRTDQKNEEKISLKKLHLFDNRAEELEKTYDGKIRPVIKGVLYARELVGEPANELYPESYAERCKELEKYGIKVKILNEAQMAELGMDCLLSVGYGSERESRLVVMEWKGGDKKDAPVAFVGKGVCFDTGGISLKPGAKMWDMIYDMGGSASVVGAMIALAKRKAKANVVGIIGLVENMPDGKATKPGDVVKTANGQTVEILNTDAEGRLVLADALWYAQEKHNPKAIIDLATLTGAVVMSLAHEYAGLFANNDELAEQIVEAGKITGDKVWRFPMGEAYNKRLKSRVADMANIASSPEGGSILAACFLERFINKNVAWAHLDIAGTAWTYEDTPTCPKGATGWGVRLLNELIEKHYEAKD